MLNEGLRWRKQFVNLALNDAVELWN